MRYLSAVCFGLVAASAAAHAQTAGNPVELYSNGYRIFGDLKGIGLYGMPVSTDGQRITYIASATFTPGAATANFQLCGSASKTVKLRSITIDGTASAQGGMHIAVRKMTSADSGGTAVTPIPMVAGNTASAVAQFNPASFGSSAGSLFNGTLNFPVIGGPNSPLVIKFGIDGTQPFTSSLATLCADVSLTGTLPTTPALDVNVVWTEE